MSSLCWNHRTLCWPIHFQNIDKKRKSNKIKNANDNRNKPTGIRCQVSNLLLPTLSQWRGSQSRFASDPEEKYECKVKPLCDMCTGWLNLNDSSNSEENQKTLVHEATIDDCMELHTFLELLGDQPEGFLNRRITNVLARSSPYTKEGESSLWRLMIGMVTLEYSRTRWFWIVKCLCCFPWNWRCLQCR